ncbi:MAG: TlpA family protein disulfide reductase [Bacteroidales bacterium]|nr:TlpA family protein disulfide reductase [Bacteroidales bacterium]
MKSLKEKFKIYLKKKSTFGKISDLIFIALIIALFIPGSRLAIGGFVNRIKSMVVEPSVKDAGNESGLNMNDYFWELEDISGKKVNLQDYKGKVVFLNLWATWCPPCVGEMPGIQQLYDKFKDNENIAFLLVSNESPERVKAFIDKKSYTFPVYTTKYKSPEVFFSQSIPTTFVISKDGIIKIKETGALNWGGSKTEKIINDLIKD